MKQEDIIRMAREAGLIIDANQSGFDSVEAFAALVASAEREECAKVCDEQANSEYWEGAYACGRNIRARGQA